MALAVTWPTPTNGFTALITIPKADTVLLSAGPPEIRSYNMDSFRAELGTLWASEEGAPYSKPFIHSGEVTVSGFTYARSVIVLDPYKIRFEDGSYVVQAFGANHNVLDVIDSTSVSVQVQNSGGLINVLELYIAAYLGSIWIDGTNGVSGTSVQGGNGTPGMPVNNIADALSIAAQTGLRALTILSGTVDVVVLPTDLKNFHIDLRALTVIDLNGMDVDGTTIVGGCIIGVGSGYIQAQNTILSDLSGLRFRAIGCALKGTIGLAFNTTEPSTFLDCSSYQPGTGTPTLDFVGPGRQVNFRGYKGGINIINMSDPSDIISVEFVAGQLIVDNSCTAGTLVYRGNVFPVDNNADGTLVVDNSTQGAVWSADLSVLTIEGTAGANLRKIFEMMGLDLGNPYFNSPSQITVAGMIFDIVESPPGTFTMTRST